MEDISSHEKFFGKKYDLSHAKIFGSITLVHIPDEKRQNLDPNLEKCIFVGYSLEQKGYKCFNPSTKKIRVSRMLYSTSRHIGTQSTQLQPSRDQSTSQPSPKTNCEFMMKVVTVCEPETFSDAAKDP